MVINLTQEALIERYPDATRQQINAAERHQEKFSLTLENLKCLNPDCNRMRKWYNTNNGFYYTCGDKNCKKITQPLVSKLRSEKAKETYFQKTGYQHNSQNPESRAKIIQTCLKNYGFNNPSQNPEIKAKKITTLFNRTGYKHNLQNPEIKAKAKETYFKKTGFDHYTRDPAVKAKKIKNYLKKTGFKHNSQNPEVQTKKINAYLEKTGFRNPFQNPEIKAKARETYFKKTGFKYSRQNPEVKAKARETYFKKTGFHNVSQKNIINYQNWNDREFWIQNFITSDNKFDSNKCLNYFNCRQIAAHRQIKKLNIEYVRHGGTSLKEKNLYTTLNDLDINFVTNSRDIIKPLELDIYIPALKLAIEYNGIYWHSYHETVGTSLSQNDYNHCKYQHQQKSIACLNAGIRLLHIYEDDLDPEAKIKKFIEYATQPEIVTESEATAKIFDLDSGCFPINLDAGTFEILEPDSRVVCKNRLLWNAGKIQIKGAT